MAVGCSRQLVSPQATEQDRRAAAPGWRSAAAGCHGLRAGLAIVTTGEHNYFPRLVNLDSRDRLAGVGLFTGFGLVGPGDILATSRRHRFAWHATHTQML